MEELSPLPSSSLDSLNTDTAAPDLAPWWNPRIFASWHRPAARKAWQVQGQILPAARLPCMSALQAGGPSGGADRIWPRLPPSGTYKVTPGWARLRPFLTACRAPESSLLGSPGKRGT